MPRKSSKKAGYGKLLDAWTPPDGSGHPVGCVATSFTFSPAFFEEECLGRFLQMETTPVEDGPLYIVEREEKLAQVSCIAAIVDQHHCRGVRSLRWDMFPCRPPSGILHAKVVLLHWSNLVRLIVSSANLTEDGYRRNQEIFGVLDYEPGAEAPRAALEESLALLGTAMQYSGNDETHVGASVFERCTGFLARVNSAVDGWDVSDTPARAAVHVVPVMVGPGRPDVLAQLTQTWPAATPPDFAAVVSPFFDPPGEENRPAQELWKHLKRRGEATVEYHVTAEEVPGEDALLLHAPESLNAATPPGRPTVATYFRRLASDPDRPAHAKSLWLEDDRWAGYLVGSSNFTSAGLGLTTRPNIEANLLYLVDYNRSETAFKSLQQCRLPSTALPSGMGVRWQPRQDMQDDGPGDEPTLPAAFGLSLFDTDAQQHGRVTFTFCATPPAGWCLYHEDEERIIYTERRWREEGSPGQAVIPWTEDRPPSGFRVRWSACPAAAWWPVNVVRSAALPPPTELKDLPLETLIDILTSARPLHKILAEHFRHRRERKNGDKSFDPDPHRRVDTSQFLLQKTRRVAAALIGLRDRLERPAATMDSLHWRLRGPIGVTAVAEALLREADLAEEKAFLLAELLLELHRVKPKEAVGSLSASTVRGEILAVVAELRERLPDIADSGLTNMRRYVDQVVKTISV